MEQNKIFIGNVAYATTMETLLDLFSQFGEIAESYKPEGKGFAFITFKDTASAEKAIEEMNGKEVDGRELVVNIARPREERPRRSFDNNRGGGYGGGRRDDNRY